MLKPCKIFATGIMFLAPLLLSARASAFDWTGPEQGIKERCKEITKTMHSASPITCEFDRKSYESRGVESDTSNCGTAFLYSLVTEPTSNMGVCANDSDCRADFSKRVRKIICRSSNKSHVELEGTSLVAYMQAGTNDLNVHADMLRVFPLANFSGAEVWTEQPLKKFFNACDVDLGVKAFSIDKAHWVFGEIRSYPPHNLCMWPIDTMSSLCGDKNLVAKLKPIKKITCSWGKHSAISLQGDTLRLVVNENEYGRTNYEDGAKFDVIIKKYFNLK